MRFHGRSIASAVLFAVLGSVLTGLGSAADWREFRGPTGDGRADAKNLPLKWSETENIVWKSALPGRGWSSPVFADGAIWLTAAIEEPLTAEQKAKLEAAKASKNPPKGETPTVGAVSLRAIGLDPQSGKVVHDVELLRVEDPAPVHALNSFASPTPILDGDKLLCHFGELGTACVDANTAQVLWKKQFPSKHSVGPGSSPVIHGDLMIVPCDGIDVQYVTAINKHSGETVWKVDRPPLTGTEPEMHKAFCTPLIVRTEGKPDQVVIPGPQWVVSYAPLTGKTLWQASYGEGFSNVPRPVAGNGLVYICTGFGTPELWAIRTDGTGDVTKTHVVWKVKRGIPAMPSPLLDGEEIYFVSDNGVASCLNAKTGEPVWQHRLAGNYSSSPLLADGKLYFCSREGKTTIVAPGRKYNELAVNTLDGQLMASPAVLGESLLLRSQNALYRIQNSQP